MGDSLSYLDNLLVKTYQTEFELICKYDFSLPTLPRFLSLPENVPVGSWQLSLPLYFSVCSLYRKEEGFLNCCCCDNL